MQKLWTAVYAPIGAASQDRRAFATGAPFTAHLPLPLCLRHGHEQVIHGTLTTLRYADGLITGEGHWLDESIPGVAESIQAVADGKLFPGLDLSAYSAQRVDPETLTPYPDGAPYPEDAVLLFTAATIIGAHLTEYPLWPETRMVNL